MPETLVSTHHQRAELGVARGQRFSGFMENFYFSIMIRIKVTELIFCYRFAQSIRRFSRVGVMTDENIVSRTAEKDID